MDKFYGSETKKSLQNACFDMSLGHVNPKESYSFHWLQTKLTATPLKSEEWYRCKSGKTYSFDISKKRIRPLVTSWQEFHEIKFTSFHLLFCTTISIFTGGVLSAEGTGGSVRKRFSNKAGWSQFYSFYQVMAELRLWEQQLLKSGSSLFWRWGCLINSPNLRWQGTCR